MIIEPQRRQDAKKSNSSWRLCVFAVQFSRMGAAPRRYDRLRFGAGKTIMLQSFIEAPQTASPVR